ncbi:MAG TPA: ABC transporter permease subunit [Anaerolineae bacterium]|nr:ABC transporter permease subunit [Anaerolineae bacterium]HNU03216.1 ABC transporter permease subunit [Anaerolineae bacterium]
MTRFILRRLLLLPIALLAINFVAFSYAILAQRVQQSQNPFGSEVDLAAPIMPLYGAYLSNVLTGDWGEMPLVGGVAQTVRAAVFDAAAASLALLALAFLLSLAVGLLLGLTGVRARPPGIKPWLPPVASLGLAAPSFFVGALGIALVLALYLRGGPDAQPILPLTGFGLDLHLVLPVLALALRPTMQIAQTTASVLVDELGKQHVVTARSFGIPWRTIRSKHALRNVLPAVILAVAAALRLMLGELILVEWLFGWPGLGKLLASALLPPTVASVGLLAGATRNFLHPELVAGLLTLFGLFFLLIDLTSSLATLAIDPRLRASLEKSDHV